MKVALAFPALPPALDGIGDHTAHLAAALAAAGHEVRVWTAQPGAAPIDGVATRAAADPLAVADDPAEAAWPDALVVQYNPFSWGAYGLNLALPERLRRLRRPGLTVGLVVHEPFVPVRSARDAVMTTWQRWQLWRLGHAADLVACAIEPWTRALRPYVGAGTTLVAVPVGSNIPRVDVGRAAAREALGVPAEALVVGMFGSARRRLGAVEAALARIRADRPATVLYVGPDGDRIRPLVGAAPLVDLGPRPSAEVSLALHSMDLHLVPYPRGVSARRGAFLAGLQHGVPSVSTVGDHTDAFLAEASGGPFVLAPEGDASAYAAAAAALAADPARRAAMAAAAVAFHDRHFLWSSIAGQLAGALAAVRAR